MLKLLKIIATKIYNVILWLADGNDQISKNEMLKAQSIYNEIMCREDK